MGLISQYHETKGAGAQFKWKFFFRHGVASAGNTLPLEAAAANRLCSQIPKALAPVPLEEQGIDSY